MPAAQRWVWASGLTVLMVGLVAALQVPVLAGYITVFGLAIVLNATLFIPTGRSAVMIAAAVMLNPLAVAVLLGIGGALGELVGYGLGRSSRGVIGDGTAVRWVTETAQRHMAPAILILSLVPNRFVDAVGIVAGRTGYPVGKFLLYSGIGKDHPVRGYGLRGPVEPVTDHRMVGVAFLDGPSISSVVAIQRVAPTGVKMT